MKIEFDTNMDCETVTDSIVIEQRSDKAFKPVIDRNTVKCTVVQGEDTTLEAASLGIWVWSGTMVNALDGIYRISVLLSRSPSDAVINVSCSM